MSQPPAGHRRLVLRRGRRPVAVGGRSAAPCCRTATSTTSSAPVPSPSCCRRARTPTTTWRGAVLDRLDGLVIAGGADVEAARYGAAAAPDLAGAAPRTATRGSSPSPGSPADATCRCSASAAACRSWRSRPGGVARPAPARRRRPRRALPAAGGVHLAPRDPGGRAPGWPSCSARDPLDVPTYHHQAVRPESLEGTAYRPVGLARRRDPRGDGGPGVRASAWRCSGTPRPATTAGCSRRSWPRPRHGHPAVRCAVTQVAR